MAGLISHVLTPRGPLGLPTAEALAVPLMSHEFWSAAVNLVDTDPCGPAGTSAARVVRALAQYCTERGQVKDTTLEETLKSPPKTKERLRVHREELVALVCVMAGGAEGETRWHPDTPDKADTLAATQCHAAWALAHLLSLEAREPLVCSPLSVPSAIPTPR